MPAADLVIRGTVLTVDDQQPTAEALAVTDGRIVAVGTTAQIESWIGPDTETLDIGDGCVMPGLVEAMTTDATPATGDDLFRQVGIKIWACHVQGDAGVDTILDIYEDALRRWPRDDHRLRLEHVGAIRDEQLQRAHDLGVTCSLFVDQIHYWGDIIVDGLFGTEHGTRWMPCGSAVTTGMRISLHNDPPVTPEEIAGLEVRATYLAGRQVYVKGN